MRRKERKGERKRRRNAASRSHERRIIVAEKEDDEGAYERARRRNGRMFRHMCFVSVQLTTRQTRTGTARHGAARRGVAAVCRFSASLFYTPHKEHSGSQLQCGILFRKLYLKFSFHLLYFSIFTLERGYIFLFLSFIFFTFFFTFFFF